MTEDMKMLIQKLSKEALELLSRARLNQLLNQDVTIEPPKVEVKN